MKKHILLIISILTAVTLLAATLTGCGSASSASGGTADGNAVTNPSANADGNGDGEKPHLVMMFPYAEIPADMQLIEDEFNRIIEPKLGCTVEIQPVTYANITDKQTLILASPSEQLDLLMGFYKTGFHGAVSKGQFKPLDDLIDQYGPEVRANADPMSLVNCSIEGHIYGIQPNRDLASSRGITFKKEIIEELNITLPDRITDYNQLTPIFAQIHEAYPTMSVFASNTVKDPLYYPLGQVDTLVDSLGVLMDMNDLTVTNLFESEEYRSYCHLVKEWNDAGYIYPDILIDSSNQATALMKNGALAAFIDVWKPGAEVEKQTATGCEVIMVPVAQPLRTTNTNWPWIIPENAVYPEKAMEIINLLFSDEELINLLCFGVEGVHWQLDEDGFVVDGPQSAGYADKKNWATGNGYIAAVQKGNPADLGAQLKNFNDNAAASAALGFIFDTENYAAEYTALQNVLNEHRPALAWGFVDDVDAAIDAMNQALYDAGLESYMSAKQSQLDEWAKTK